MHLQYNNFSCNLLGIKSQDLKTLKILKGNVRHIKYVGI